MVRAMSQDAWSNTIAERNHILCESSSYCVCCNVGVFIIYVPVTSGLSIEEVARVSVFRGRYDRHARDTRKICTVAQPFMPISRSAVRLSGTEESRSRPRQRA